MSKIVLKGRTIGGLTILDSDGKSYTVFAEEVSDEALWDGGNRDALRDVLLKLVDEQLKWV